MSAEKKKTYLKKEYSNASQFCEVASERSMRHLEQCNFHREVQGKEFCDNVLHIGLTKVKCGINK